MKNQFFILFILTAITFSIHAQKRKSFFDGPYIKESEDTYLLQWIAKGKVKDSIVQKSEASLFKNFGLPEVNLNDLGFAEDNYMRYDSVDQFLAISDIHGQHDLFLELLKAHNVVDSTSKWNFKKGHLVIVGDIFDRGDKVTETLWFLFNLEKQAATAGGKVHVLLGNHELMILHNDVRYINPKYRFTTGAFKTPYPDFFSENTVLGTWLRSKNVCVTINDVVFVHGGFSRKVLEKEESLNVINQTFKDSILNDPPKVRDTSSLSSLLYFDNGPLWFRGYADPNGFDLERANAILKTLDAKSIVVGHTSMPRIVSLHNNKILLIDSSIKFGKSGEVLIYSDTTFYRGLLSGEKIPIHEKHHESYTSPFQYVYNLGEHDLKIKLITDIDNLIEHKKDEPYQDAKLIAYHNQEFNRSWDVRVRARGNMRKEICHLPPLKIDFQKKTLEYLGFSSNDKLKLVLPCDDTKAYHQGLYKEYLVYKLYEHIDTLALRTKLIDMVFEDDGKIVYDVTGFFIENEEEFEQRNNIKIIEKGIVVADALERSSLLKFAFFQYMILNTDWAFFNKHNVEILKCQNHEKPLVIPYDFDYAGIVNQDYAAPSDKMGINDVRQASFRCKYVTIEEMELMHDFFNSIKKDMIATIESATYLNEKNRSGFKSDLEKFYKKLNNKKKWEKRFLNKE